MLDHCAGNGRLNAVHSPDPPPGLRRVNGDAASPPMDEEAAGQVKGKLRDLGYL